MESGEPSLVIVGRVREYTVKEYAALEQVEPRTVWRWIEKGAVNVRKTPGGRYRVCLPVVRDK